MQVPRELVTVITEQDINATEKSGRLIRAMMFESGDLPASRYMNLIQCHE